MNSDIDNGVSVLNQGGIIIFPTDTAFGIGCRIDKEDTIKRLFRIRRRPKDKPVPVLSASFKMAEKYLRPVNQRVISQLIKKYWPGGLTIVLPCVTENVPDLIRGGGNSIGLRVPNHLTTLEIIQTVGVPILGPSANFHGMSTPFFQKDLDPDLLKLVDFVVPGICYSQKSSTVIDCTVEPWNVVRPGAVLL